MYVYFWVPSTHDNCYLIPTDFKKKRDINDISDNVRLNLEIEMHSSTKDLSVLLVADNGYRQNFMCKFVRQEPNGIFIYEIDDEIDEIDRKLLEIQVFHLFKSFFHKHVFHSEGNDRIIGGAYFGETSDELQSAMQHYLEKYKEKYKMMREDLLPSISKTEIIKEFEENANIIKVAEDINNILKIIRIGKGELIFARYLAADYLRRYGDYKYVDILKKEERFLDIFEKDALRALERAEIQYTTSINTKQDILTAISLVFAILSIIFTIF